MGKKGKNKLVGVQVSKPRKDHFLANENALTLTTGTSESLGNNIKKQINRHEMI
jgi:hypothetical protein